MQSRVVVSDHNIKPLSGHAVYVVHATEGFGYWYAYITSAHDIRPVVIPAIRYTESTYYEPIDQLIGASSTDEAIFSTFVPAITTLQLDVPLRAKRLIISGSSTSRGALSPGY